MDEKKVPMDYADSTITRSIRPVPVHVGDPPMTPLVAQFVGG